MRWQRLALASLITTLTLTAARAQQPVAPATTIGNALRSLAARASTVFVGQVTSIIRKGGVVEIAFRVDQSILGSASSTFTFREWAGLWPPGQARYWPGQRAMLFLPSPAATAGSSASGLTSPGLTSPVDGPSGILPVLVQGAGLDPLLDIRLLDANLLRQPGEPLTSLATAAIPLSEAVATVRAWQEPILHEPRRLPLPIAPVPLPILRGRVVTATPPFVANPHIAWQPAESAHAR
jgi:hypothetical protein